MNLKRLPDTERTVVDSWVEVDGYKYNMNYLLNLLEEVESLSGRFGGIEVFGEECENLKKAGILSTCGNKRFCEGAMPGKNFEKALAFVQKEYEKDES